eukprot:Polyplicarium_translucidae@DN2831_c0_g1_i1.p1
MICVECAEPVPFTYRHMSGGLRLYQCHSCARTADKYCEYDFSNFAIDIVLHRVEAYRHLIFNRMQRTGYPCLSADVFRVAVMTTLLDAYVNWFTQKASTQESAFASKPAWSVEALSGNVPFFHFATAALELPVFLFGILIGTRVAVFFLHERKCKNTVALVNYQHVIAAVVLSMYGKLGILLMAIWDCERELRHPIALFVASSNVVALSAFLGRRSIGTACAIVALGHAFRLAFWMLVSWSHDHHLAA